MQSIKSDLNNKFNIIEITIDMGLYFRNSRLDRIRDAALETELVKGEVAEDILSSISENEDYESAK